MSTTASGIEPTTEFTNLTETDVCETEQDQSAYFAVILIVICVLMLMNILLLVAITANWRILRQNIVYRYLISCLVSSFCFCFLGAYEICHSEAYVDNQLVEGGVLQRYNMTDPVHRHVMRAWAYRKSLLVCVLIIMEFNIAALIYAMCDNTHFVGRYSEPKPVSRPDNRQTQDNLKNRLFHATKGKKFKAVCLILGSWIIPLVLSIPTAIDWSCMEHCQCLPAFRGAGITCSAKSDSGVVCSRVWMPTTRSFGVVITLLFFLAIVFMFVVLILVVRKFYKSHTPRKSKTNLTESRRKKIGEVNAHGRRNSRGGFRHTSPTQVRSRSYHGTMTRVSSAPIVRSPSARETRRNLARFSVDSAVPTKTNMNESNKKSYSPSSVDVTRNPRPPLHSTIKLLIALTTTYTLSVSPMIFIWFYDFLIYPDTTPSAEAFDTSIAITYIHSATLPFILLRYMSGLRKACVNILLKCPCLSTTEITKKRPTRPVEKKRDKSRGNPTNKSHTSPKVSDQSATETSNSKYTSTSFKERSSVKERVDFSANDGVSQKLDDDPDITAGVIPIVDPQADINLD